MATTSTTPDKAAQIADLRILVDRSLSLCRLEMLKAEPDLDYSFEFAEKALKAIGTLRIMTIGGRV